MTQYQLAIVRRCARMEARYLAGLWKRSSQTAYSELVDQACSEFGIDRHHPAYPRLRQAISDYADSIIERNEVAA